MGEIGMPKEAISAAREAIDASSMSVKFHERPICDARATSACASITDILLLFTADAVIGHERHLSAIDTWRMLYAS